MSGKDIRVLFGQNLKKFRNRRNWSQTDLAEHAHITINFLGDIERGKKWPSPNTLSGLADALEINIAELFTNEDLILTSETRVTMDRFINDVSLGLHKSLALSVNQTLEYIKKQYKSAAGK